ncbi:MAG TPA: SPOR domain-containing protein [Candidatus Sulfotelmatobacter sp.]|nr:SPOR domain-containing protein [Candidatus Sulfotelmatobacter sp.]
MHQEFDPRDLEPAMPARAEASARSKIAPILIALVALAGFSGVVWYAYVQGVRQSAPPGATPLIKADTSPAKVRPEQPGGMDVPHQNMQVLNTLPEGDKAAAPPVERLLPPPETPLPRPTDTAAAMSSTATASSSSALPPKIGPTPTSGPSVAPPVTAPIAAASPAPAVAAAAAPTPPAPVQTASTPAPAAPPAPPAKTQVAAAPAAAPKAAPASGGGGFRVQLVSVRAQDQTAQEWARLQRTFPALAALHMSVMRVDLGEKGVWYRIYGGPLSDAAAAGQVCGAIKAKDSKQGCLVVKP